MNTNNGFLFHIFDTNFLRPELKRSISYLYCLSLILLLSACSTINDTNDLRFSISLLQDLDTSETQKSVLQAAFSPLESPNIGFENGIYWFKVIVDQQTIDKPFVFDIPESNVHEVTVYQDAKIVPTKTLTNTHFSLLITSNSENPVYFLKVLFKNEVYFPLKVKLYDDTQLAEKYSFFINGIYYGFVLVALILNFFFYFSLKDRTFIYYCLFLISIAIGMLFYDGFLQIIIPDTFSRFTGVFAHFLITFLGYLFGYKFLNADYYLPKINRLGFILLSIAIFSYFLFIPTNQYFYVAIADTVSFFVLLFNWILGIIIYKKHEFAKFFVIGYSLVLFSAAFFIIPIDWGINMYTTSVGNVRFGSVFEILILTYAITYRITILQKENEKFRTEIQEYLNKIDVLNTSKNITIEGSIQQLIVENDLSQREADVLLLVFKGYTNKRIGDELFISLNTVKYHIRNIYQKLNIKTKNEAIDLYTKIKKS